tara:strand:+ start:82 stop:543 length:462 start_codon:yes stop_codon:yes gene_type:complete
MNKLFVDLDGVLADFDTRVHQLCGEWPWDMDITSKWEAVCKDPKFFENLPWMEDGKDLWEAVKIFCPTILTGVPRMEWAAPQKRSWCARELGSEVPVITCMSYKKPIYANGHYSPILIDDSRRAGEGWEKAGGIFILHESTKETLTRLHEYSR